MDKVFSARIDESVVALIDALSRQLRVPKKRVIEDAVRAYSQGPETGGEVDVFSETCGLWERPEPAGKTVEDARTRFSESMRRHFS